MGKFLIDTNVCIYHFEEFPDVVQFMRKIKLPDALIAATNSQVTIMRGLLLAVSCNYEKKLHFLVHFNKKM